MQGIYPTRTGNSLDVLKWGVFRTNDANAGERTGESVQNKIQHKYCIRINIPGTTVQTYKGRWDKYEKTILELYLLSYAFGVNSITGDDVHAVHRLLCTRVWWGRGREE